MTACQRPGCTGEIEAHRIGRGTNRRGSGVEVAFCPSCNSVVSVGPAAGSTVLAHAEGYQPRPRKDLDG